MPPTPEKPAQTTSVTRILLVFGLIIAIGFAYVGFFALPSELKYDPTEVRGLPSAYEVTKTTIGSATISTNTISEGFTFQNYPAADWTGAVTLAPTGGGRYRILISATSLYDDPVPLESFDAKIVQTGNLDQALPGVQFSETSPGEYTADIILPDNGEWEVRARLKKGMDTIFLAQKIAPLLRPLNTPQ
jgi:hypothetical protein